MSQVRQLVDWQSVVRIATTPRCPVLGCTSVVPPDLEAFTKALRPCLQIRFACIFVKALTF